MSAKKAGGLEGCMYAVPLPSGGYCIMLVAAKARKNRTFYHGRFYLHQCAEVPSQAQAEEIVAHTAFEVFQHGPLGFRDGSWIPIGPLRGYRREVYFQREWYATYLRVVCIHDEDRLHMVRSRPVADPRDTQLPVEGSSGHLAVALKMDALIREGDIARSRLKRQEDENIRALDAVLSRPLDRGVLERLRARLNSKKKS